MEQHFKSRVIQTTLETESPSKKPVTVRLEDAYGLPDVRFIVSVDEAPRVGAAVTVTISWD